MSNVTLLVDCFIMTDHITQELTGGYVSLQMLLAGEFFPTICAIDHGGTR